jgi:hypothetical protein
VYKNAPLALPPIKKINLFNYQQTETVQVTVNSVHMVQPRGHRVQRKDMKYWVISTILK